MKEAPAKDTADTRTAAPIPVAIVEEKPRATEGRWECLNDPRNCKLAAPDPRTEPVLFIGPTQVDAREAGPVRCPECNGEKVIYRGDVTENAEAAA